MPYPVPHVHAWAEGHFGSTATDIVEHWQAGFHITKNGGVIGGTSEMTTFLTAIRAPLTTYHQTLAVGAGNTTWLDAAAGAYIGTDGKYALGALQTTTRVPLTSPAAGQGSAGFPWATAIAITLRSLLTRGPASHGRIYWPATAVFLTTSTGRLTSSQQTTWATNAKTLIDAINVQAAAAFGAGATVGLVSQVRDGYQSPVIRVGIGAKPDHMESREKDLPEAHVYANTLVAARLLEELDDDFRDAMRDEFPDADLP
jgi:hypothetical protein